MTDKKAKLTGQHSDNNNDLWYTPEHVIDAVRSTLGAIDLDPASDLNANQVVNAGHYFTEQDNGIEQAWYGNVFMNPPFSRKWFSPFCFKAVSEFEAGNVNSMIVLVNANTDTKAAQAMMNAAVITCLTKGRLAFREPSGRVVKGNSKGQMILLFTKDTLTMNKFNKHFADIGKVLLNPIMLQSVKFKES